MPEGPETRAMADFMHKDMVGKTIISISEMKGMNASYLPLTVKQVWSKAKRVIISCIAADNKQMHIFCFLALTGIWRRNEGKYTKKILNFGEIIENEKIQIIIKKDSYYYDDRDNKGKMKVLNDFELTKEFAKTGADILDMTPSLLKSHILSQPSINLPLYTSMLDTKTFVGVGNIYRAEILYYAGIDPKRSVSMLNEKEIDRLCEVSVHILKLAYQQGGCSFQDYILPDGNKGGYINVIYRRNPAPCGNAITFLEDDNNRKMYWCPNSQR